MKRIASTTTALMTATFLSGTAFAADFETAAPAPSPTYDWSGSYVGIQGGAAFEGDATAINPLIGIPVTASEDGGLGGILFGYNFQRGNIVFGIDSDFSGTSLSFAVAGSDFDLRTLGTTRARIGYAFDNVLPYVTGGLATSFANFDTQAAGLGSDNDFGIGWTAGAGIEIAFSENVRGRLQYNYVDIGSFDFNFGPTTLIEADVDNLHLIRAGVSIRTRAIIDAIRGR